jgi:hypothetical protein
MKEGIQNPVLTCTKAAPASDQPTIKPSTGMPARKPHAEAFLAVDFEQFTERKLSYTPGNVKLWESPGTAGGLPRRTKKDYPRAKGGRIMALYLVRHGKSLAKETDPEQRLSEEELAETERIAAVAKEYGVRVSCIAHCGRRGPGRTNRRMYLMNTSALVAVGWLTFVE